jgi:hypothetical protein
MHAARTGPPRNAPRTEATMTTTAQPVALSTLPPGATFHVPATGHEGTVDYHSAGSSTVAVRKFRVDTKTKEVKSKKKGGETVLRDVTTAQYEQDRTQWALGTMVVPGPMPQAMREEREQEAKRLHGLLNPTAAVPPELADNPFLADDVPEPKPTKRARVAPVPVPQGQAYTGDTVQVEVPGRLMPRPALGAKGTLEKQLAKVTGLHLREVKKSGAGSTCVYDATMQGAATLLDILRARKDGTKPYGKLLKKLGRAGVEVTLRETAGMQWHIVNGAVSAAAGAA